MTIKVVRGLVNPVETANAPLNSNSKPSHNTDSVRPASGVQQQSVTQQALNQSTNSVVVHAFNQVATSEAVVTNFKSARTNQSPEKIKDFKEAKALAKNTADKITAFGKASLDAHGGLESGSAQGVL